MHNWVAGEEVTAAKLNQLNPEAESRISQAEHNLLELYLENYFSGKNTPFQALFFDGFSDTSKAESTNGGTNVSGTAGQNQITLNSATELGYFKVDDLVHIYDAVKGEVKRIIAKAFNALESDLASFVYSTDNASYWNDNGIQGGTREVRWAWNSNPPPSRSSLTKTFNLTAGQQYTFKVTARYRSAGGSHPWFYTRIFVDGVEKLTYNYFQADDRTVNHSFTFTPASSTCQIEIRSTWEAFGGGSISYSVLFDYSNFEITQGYILYLDNNLANSYSNGNVKKVTATLDTGGKRLTVTAGIGNGKYFLYQTKRQTFFQKMASAKLWVMRNNLAKYSPNVAVANGATSVAQQMQAGTFGIGDTLDIYTADQLIRERKTVTNVSDGGSQNLTIDQVTTNLANNQPTHTMAHITSNNANKLLLVAIESWGDNNGSGQIPTSVTYNGVGMTKLSEGNNGNGRNGISFWKLLNPATGTNNVVATYSSGPPNQRITAIGFYNARDTATATNFGFVSNNFAKNITSETGGICVDLLGCDLGNPSLSVNGGQTVRSTDNFRTGVSTKPATGGLTTMGWVMSNYEGNYMGVCVLPVIPTLTITFTPAIQKADGFTTADFFERVDVKPRISIVGTGANNNFEDLVYQSTLPVIIQEDGLTYYEDEYSYAPASPNNDMSIILEITRGDTGLAPAAKRLGVSLNT